MASDQVVIRIYHLIVKKEKEKEQNSRHDINFYMQNFFIDFRWSFTRVKFNFHIYSSSMSNFPGISNVCTRAFPYGRVYSR